MVEISQKVIEEVVSSVSGILEALSFLLGYTIAQVKSMGEICSDLVDTMLDGYKHGLQLEQQVAA